MKNKMNKNKTKIKSYDVVISGGGMVGLTLAIGLAQGGFDVVVVDMAPEGDLTDTTFDGRASALAYAPYKMLETLGIWKYASDHAQPINEIRVSDGDSLMFIHFDKKYLGDGPMGFLVENRRNRIALFKRAKELDNLTLIAPDKVTTAVVEGERVAITLEGGKHIDASIIIGAEGRNSPTRERAGIKMVTAGYDQWGIVTTVEHSVPHNGMAHERFLPDGPFALLPLTGNRSSLVWSVRSEQVKTIMDLNDRAFDHEIWKRSSGVLGDIKSTGPRFSYPLSTMLAERYTDDRMFLVGDAAHGMHPIAGQGVNLGYRDVAALIEVLMVARANGQDIGSEEARKSFEQWRRVDNVTLLAVMDGLTRLFSNDIAPLRLARDIGLWASNKSVPLKKFFMKHARGDLGSKIPALLRGESLDSLKAKTTSDDVKRSA
jgi:2-octaprenyl-6-methoxyphenol hydroxylase